MLFYIEHRSFGVDFFFIITCAHYRMCNHFYNACMFLEFNFFGKIENFHLCFHSLGFFRFKFGMMNLVVRVAKTTNLRFS